MNSLLPGAYILVEESKTNKHDEEVNYLYLEDHRHCGPRKTELETGSRSAGVGFERSGKSKLHGKSV